MGSIRVIMTALNQLVAARGIASPGLVKRWFGLIYLIVLSLGLVYLCLQIWWSPQFANRWLGLAATFTAVLIAMVGRNLSYNHRPGERTILVTFGAGNQLTILRGVMITFLAGFLLSPWPPGWLAWLPGMIYILAAILDLFDGYLARRANQVTRLGEILDMNLDGLGVLVACLLIVQYGQVPAWYLLVGLARYMFLAAEWALKRIGRPVFQLAPNPARRPLAGAQMGFIAAVLLPVFSPPGTYLVAGLFAVPFLVGFAYDGLAVSGALRIYMPGGSEVGRRIDAKFELIKSLVGTWLPLVARILVVLLLFTWLSLNIPGIISHWDGMSSSLHIFIPSPLFWLGLMLLLTTAGLVSIVLGVAGRLAALLIMFGIGLFQSYAVIGWMEVTLLVGATMLMYLGTGPYSLWSPEERIIAKRIGEV